MVKPTISFLLKNKGILKEANKSKRSDHSCCELDTYNSTEGKLFLYILTKNNLMVIEFLNNDFWKTISMMTLGHFMSKIIPNIPTFDEDLARSNNLIFKLYLKSITGITDRVF